MLKWIQKKKNQKGFTLVELVVVIAILGILAGLAVPRFGALREDAQKKANNASAAVIGKAAEAYLAVNPDKVLGENNELDIADLVDYLDAKTRELGTEVTITVDNGDVTVEGPDGGHYPLKVDEQTPPTDG